MRCVSCDPFIGKPRIPEDLTRQIFSATERLSNCLIISYIGNTTGNQRLGRLQGGYSSDLSP